MPWLVTKIVDLDLRIAPAQLCHLLVEEFLLSGGRDEVGFPEGQRTVFQVTEEKFEFSAADAVHALPDDAVILASGGGTGIAAECLQRLAKPGMRIILTGRSTLGDEVPELRGANYLQEFREHFIAQSRRLRDHASLGAIECRVSQAWRDSERRRTIHLLQSLGAEVEYVPTDMRDEASVSSLVERLYLQYRRIDAVFHAAGIIADKLIGDKPRAAFDSVFDTKADGAYLLAKHLRPDSLKLIVFFGSTAGRFGNPGQSDYSAANELLNRIAWFLHHRWPLCHVLAVNWGPWSGRGMAGETVNAAFRERGIVPISIPGGCSFLNREIARGRGSGVEVIAGDGPWNRSRRNRLEQLLDLGTLFLPPN